MDVLRVVAPPRIYQYIAFYDNSSIHNKRGDLTLSASRTSAKWGGKQAGLRDSKIIEGCIGDHPALMWYLPGQGTGEWRGGPKWVPEGTKRAVARDCKLKVGEIDYGRFKDDDPPPFYELNAQRYDRPMTRAEIIVERQRFVSITSPDHTHLQSLRHTHTHTHIHLYIHTPHTHTTDVPNYVIKNCQRSE